MSENLDETSELEFPDSVLRLHVATGKLTYHITKHLGGKRFPRFLGALMKAGGDVIPYAELMHATVPDAISRSVEKLRKAEPELYDLRGRANKLLEGMAVPRMVKTQRGGYRLASCSWEQVRKAREERKQRRNKG